MKRRNDIFDDFYENLPKGRCHPCKYAKVINAGDNWVFLSCWHEPYRGKWVAEIKDCPVGKEVKMQIINANEVKELINTKLDSFKKEMIDSIDAQLTTGDINVAIERLEYELKDAEEHREDLTPNTEQYYVNRGYVSGIMTALLIIKKGLK